MGLGRSMPPSFGRRVARGVSRMIVAADGPLLAAVRANQSVVAGRLFTKAELDDRALEVFQYTAMSLYDLYHRLDDDAAIHAIVVYAPGLEDRLEEWMREERGICFVGPHLAGFDIVLRSLALRGLRPQTLSLPDPSQAHRRENELRRQVGLDVTPIGHEALKRAARTLTSGGHVLTGVDFPVPRAKMRTTFFGRPAGLPTLHVRLALSTGSPVVLLHCRRTAEGLYELHASKSIEMVRQGDRRETIRTNTERILEMVAARISEVPTQWGMTHRVWPDDEQAPEQVPGRDG
jgi:lauroyl/myristoyl acyltransferase